MDKKVVYYKTGLIRLSFQNIKLSVPNYIFSNGNLEAEASGSAISLLIAQDFGPYGRKIDFEIKYKDKTFGGAKRTLQ